MTSEYEQIRAYHADLGRRVEAREQWRKRHPDYRSDLYQQEMDMYWALAPEEREAMARLSTFDPSDPAPQTSDLLTSELLVRLMGLALAAYERATGIPGETR